MIPINLTGDKEKFAQNVMLEVLQQAGALPRKYYTIFYRDRRTWR